MDAVREYKERRKARLDQRVIERFRIRRDARLNGRMDDEEETNNNPGGSGGGSGGGHGNTKIPFGLCQREGIQIDPKWTPKDAWEALSGKGYSAGEVYKTLKETGKVGEKKSKKAPTKLDESHFPDGMLAKTYRKNTLEFAKYINEHCKDPEVTELLSLGSASGAKQFPRMTVKRSMDGEGCYVRPSWRTSDKSPYEYEIVIPQISKATTPEQRAQAVRSFAHEYTHFLDDMARERETKCPKYSGADKELNDAIAANDWQKYSEEAENLFKEYDKGYTKIIEDWRKSKSELPLKVAMGMFGERPSWISEEGRIGYGRDYYADWERVNRYTKALKAAERELAEKRNRDKRAYMDGVTCLQGMYDALSGGQMRATGKVRFGHSTSYYTRDPENKAVELLADYVALKATRPDLVEIFRKDKPQIAVALDKTISGMVKRLRGV